MAVCDNHYLPQWVGAGHDHLRHLKMRQVKPKKKKDKMKSHQQRFHLKSEPV